jgi:hypothetical protein
MSDFFRISSVVPVVTLVLVDKFVRTGKTIGRYEVGMLLENQLPGAGTPKAQQALEAFGRGSGWC